MIVSVTVMVMMVVMLQGHHVPLCITMAMIQTHIILF